MKLTRTPPVTASERGQAQHRIPRARGRRELWCLGARFRRAFVAHVLLTVASLPKRVQGPYWRPTPALCVSEESGCLRLQPKFGGRLHLRLSTDARPIDNKYREGKLKRTLKREFKST